MGELICSEEKKKHIGILVHVKPWQGGSYQYVEFILDAFAACLDEYVVDVICTESGWEKILKERYPLFSCHRVPFSYEFMVQEIDNMGFDYIFMPTYGVDYFYEITFKTPLISVIHDLMYYFQPRGKMWTCKESSYFYQKQCQRSIGVFVDSNMGKDHCMEALGHMYEEKLYVLPFRIPNYLYETTTKEVFLKNKKFIFYPAQFFRIKNHINLLLALYFLRRKGIYVNLLFTGKGKAGYDDVYDMVKMLDLETQVEIIDYVNGAEMKYLLQEARAMIMPSYAGPTNIPPLEAMFMGCPIAVSDIFAMPEQIGDAGLIFDPKSIDDIADVLEQLWVDDELCKKLSLRAKNRVEMFSKELFNQRFRKEMRAIIQKHKSSMQYLENLVCICRQYREIYLYGAGEIGFLVGNYLRDKKDIHISGYIVSSLDSTSKELLGIPIYCFSDIKEKLKNALVILALSENIQREITPMLCGVKMGMIHDISNQEKNEAWVYYVNAH
ncbi:MAG: glycosyltransferase family 4 protein [Selenomonadaceae bacterium]|nr:glycosyltransferase family 4 protein [Selenomonadaceae bacterium]